MTPQEFKAARKTLNLTQGALACLCGVSVRAIQHYETPEHLPSARKPHPAIIKILEGLLKPESKIVITVDEYKHLLDNCNLMVNIDNVYIGYDQVIELTDLKIQLTR